LTPHWRVICPTFSLRFPRTKSGLSNFGLVSNVPLDLGDKAGKADQIHYLGSFQMRSFISKAVLGTMIAGAALAVSACTKTETTTNVTDMNVTDETATDNMTAVDGGAMNGTDMMSNDTAPTANTTM
jgi:hypothetical protein